MAKMEYQIRKALKLLSDSDVVNQGELSQAGIGDNTIKELLKLGLASLGSLPSGIALYSITDAGRAKAEEPIPSKPKARAGLKMLEPRIRTAPSRLK